MLMNTHCQLTVSCYRDKAKVSAVPSPTPNYLWTILALWRFTALQHQLLPFMSFCFSVLMPSVMELVRATVTSSLSVSKHKTKSSQLVELKVKMTEKTKWNSHLKQQTQVLSGH